MKAATVSRTITGLAVLLFGGISQAAEQTQPYVMSVVEDAPHGRLVLNGSDESAIQKLYDEEVTSTLTYSKATSLCVALTRTRQLELAEPACEQAILRSKTLNRDARPFANNVSSTVRLSDINYAAAMTNRGVLYAISGDQTSAQKHFESALDADPYQEAAQMNLAKLRTQ